MPHFRLHGEIESQPLSFPLKSGEVRVGNHPENHLVLAASGVSRRHATLEVTRQGVSLRDLDSKNGTFVNGEQVRDTATLAPGDLIELGQARLRLEAVDAEDVELGLALDHGPAETGSGRRPPGETTELHSSLQDDRRPAASELVLPAGYVPGESPAMRTLYAQMRPLARGELPILILGETGVGKEYVARILHSSSLRSSGPFVAINCAAIPAELLEAELFGIERGVASGVTGRTGKFHQARGGTLFLDEIGDMSADLQAKLLRALQEKEIQPVGGRAVATDVRIVAATNTDLKTRIEEGAFRRDLYYRLAGSTLIVPTLAERQQDIPGLVEHFVRAAAEGARRSVRGVTVKALRALLDHPWPGNVRELEHEIERLVCLCGEGQVIDSSMLSREILEGPRSDAPASAAPGDEPAAESADLANPMIPDGEFNLEEIEKRVIERALAASGGVQVQAARRLGISRDALRRRIERYGL
ncbi:MAG: FHA domain-containing protein [bacterium]|nr:FHA domain-containing protein [bacterium]